MALRVILEVAPKKSFASAIDWPGWCRGARTPDEATEALLAYAPRYARVANRAGVAFDPPRVERGIEIVERLAGGSGTDFGVPSSVATADADPPPPAELDRLLSLLDAAWTTFDRAAERAYGTQLRLGPRGGGRQVPKMLDHVHEAEAAYLHQLGWKVRDREIGAVRRAFAEAVRLRAAGAALPDPNRVARPWPPRYAIRRSAWHALDHAWEIEDRSG